MATMKAVQITKANGPFEVVERDIPKSNFAYPRLLHLPYASIWLASHFSICSGKLEMAV